VSVEDPIVLVVISFILLGVLLAIGIKIAIALAMVGVIGFFIYMGNLGLTADVPYRTLDSFVLTAVPLFIFMGEILVQGGISEKVYRGTSKLFAWAPGGLLHSNIGACAMFAAISGSSPATAATIGTVAYPALKGRNYNRRLILGSLAAGGTLGILIPPSINLIVYGMLSETSVGALFIGGVVPGIILALMFMIYIAVRAVINSQLAPKEEAFSIKNVFLSFTDLWPFLVLAVIVLGGIFGGLMTPTEAAAIGSSAAIVLALILRRFSWQILRRALSSALATTCMCLFIVVGASILSSFFSRAGIPAAVAKLVLHSGFSPIMIMMLLYLLYIFLGCFIDGLSMMVLTIPTVLPIVIALGYDPLWFGVVLVVLAEIGMLTPPMGLNLFVIYGISREKLGEVILGSVPFFLIMLVCLALLTAVPNLVLWLPSLMY